MLVLGLMYLLPMDQTVRSKENNEILAKKVWFKKSSLYKFFASESRNDVIFLILDEIKKSAGYSVFCSNPFI